MSCYDPATLPFMAMYNISANLQYTTRYGISLHHLRLYQLAQLDLAFDLHYTDECESDTQKNIWRKRNHWIPWWLDTKLILNQCACITSNDVKKCSYWPSIAPGGFLISIISSYTCDLYISIWLGVTWQEVTQQILATWHVKFLICYY